MKLLCCHVEQFGTLSNYDRNFSNGLNVIYAENGFGKTTLAAFCMAMFYGLQQSVRKQLSENERRKYRPWQGGRYGGWLEFEYRGKNYRIERFFGEQKRNDTCRLIDLLTGKETNEISEPIGESIFGLDYESFKKSAFMPEQGAEVEYTDAIGSRIGSKYGEDVESGSFEQAVELLTNKAKQYESIRGSKGEIPRLREKEYQMSILEAEAAKARIRLNDIKESENVLKQEQIALEEEKNRYRDQLKKKSEKQLSKVIKQQYAQMEKSLKEQEVRLQELEALYPNGFPEAHECLQCIDRIAERDNLLEYELEQTKNPVYNQQWLDEVLQELDEIPKEKEKFKVLDWALVGTSIASFVAMLILLIFSNLVAVACLLISVVSLVYLVYRENDRKKEYGWQSDKRARLEDKKELLEARMAEEEKRTDTLKKRMDLDEKIQNFCTKFTVIQDGTERQQCLKMAEACSEWEKLSKEWNDNKESAEAFLRENRSVIESDDSDEECEVIEIDEEANDRRYSENQRKLFELNREKNTVEEAIRQGIIASESRAKCEAERIRYEEEKRMIEKTVALLQQARDSFSASYLNGIEKKFEEYTTKCFDKEIGDFRIDTELKLWISRGGESRGVEWFSRGSRDILGICLRLAIVDVLYPSEPPFLLLDDPFVHLDEKNQERLAKLFCELTQTYQIICFSCRDVKV